MKKIAVTGGAPVALASIPGSLGSFSWGRDDTIVFGTLGVGIMRVSANGGIPEVILKAGSEGFINPQILPDGNSVLFTNISSQPHTIMVESLKSGQRKTLFPGDTARYLPTGHVVYGVGSNIFAIPFDADRLEVTGGPVPMVEGVFRMGGAFQYAVSESGTLVYIPGTELTAATPSQRTLVWVDRTGKEESLGAPTNAYAFPRISPDGTRVALAISTGGNEDIWIWDLRRKTLTRLTFDPGIDTMPLWTPDSRRIAYFSLPAEGKPQICWKAADGTGKVELLGSLPNTYSLPSSWADNGKTLIATVFGYSNLGSDFSTRSIPFDVGALTMEGDHKGKMLLQEKYTESQPGFRRTADGWRIHPMSRAGTRSMYVRIPIWKADAGKSLRPEETARYGQETARSCFIATETRLWQSR